MENRARITNTILYNYFQLDSGNVGLGRCVCGIKGRALFRALLTDNTIVVASLG